MAAPAEPPQTATSRPSEARKAEPLIQVDSWGERLGVVAMLVLILGALLPSGSQTFATFGPFALSVYDLIPLVLGILGLMQVASTASKASNVVMLGLASLSSLAAVGAEVASNLVTHGPFSGAAAVMLIGIVLGLVAMDVMRREARLDYVLMATRALELAMQPRVQVTLLKLFLPFAFAGCFVFLILEVFGESVANKLAATFVLYFFNPVGKEVGIPFGLTEQRVDSQILPALDPGLVWTFIVFIDICTALFFVWNYDHVLRVPFMGRFFAWVERRGNEVVAKRKWIARLAFFGLVLYATLPLEGTGAIGGSVVGRGIGLNATLTFLAVAVGSIVRTSLTMLVVLGALNALGF
jgi:uncharacterized membrane protein